MTEKTALALPLSPAISQANGHCEDHGVMPGEFVGMYQAGFDAGYEQGRETGYRQGFNERDAAVQPGANNGAAVKLAVEGKPAPGSGPRQRLLGMPCRSCRVYLLNDETCCPCCKQPRAA